MTRLYHKVKIVNKIPTIDCVFRINVSIDIFSIVRDENPLDKYRILFFTFSILKCTYYRDIYFFWFEWFPHYTGYGGWKAGYFDDGAEYGVVDERFALVVDEYHGEAEIFGKYFLYACIVFVFSDKLPLVNVKLTYISALELRK